MQYHVITLDAKQHVSFLEQGRRDPVTKEEFKVGDRVVMCAACRSAFLEGSWRTIGRSHCGQERTLKNLAVDIGRKWFSRADTSAGTPTATGPSPAATASAGATTTTPTAAAPRRTPIAAVPPASPPPVTPPPAPAAPAAPAAVPHVPTPGGPGSKAGGTAPGPLRLKGVPVRLADVPISLRPVVPLKRVYR